MSFRRASNGDVFSIANLGKHILCRRPPPGCQFQYRDDFPSQSSARKSVRRKELLLNGAEVKNDVKVRPLFCAGWCFSCSSSLLELVPPPPRILSNARCVGQVGTFGFILVGGDLRLWGDAFVWSAFQPSMCARTGQSSTRRTGARAKCAWYVFFFTRRLVCNDFHR